MDELYHILSDKSRFLFIMTNENEKVMTELAKFVFYAMKVRQTAMLKAK